MPAHPTARIRRQHRAGRFRRDIEHFTVLDLDANSDIALNPERPRILRVSRDGMPARNTVERDSSDNQSIEFRCRRLASCRHESSERRNRKKTPKDTGH